MAVKSTDTYLEWLQKVHHLVSQGKQMTDALPHLAEITDLETTVLTMLHQPVDNAQPNSQVPVPPGAPMMDPMAGGGGGMPPGPPITPGIPGGPMPQAPQINPDELRRVLGNGG